MGNDVCLAWPWAELAVMGAGQAAAILQRRATPEERAAFEADYAERLLNPYIAAERGYIDAVIDPAETRREIAAALDALADKREQLRPRKHGNEPLLRACPRPRPLGAAPLTARGRREPVGLRPGERRRSNVPSGEEAPGPAVSDEGNHVPDTITITDDRTGKTVTVPITDGVFPSSALRELDPSLFMYDPAYLSTAACRSDITYLDGDAGHPALPRLPDRAARRALDVPRGRLPPALRRAARRAAARAVDLRRHPPHVHPREHAQAVRRRVPLRRPPDGHVRVRRSPPSARSTTTPRTSSTTRAGTSRSSA